MLARRSTLSLRSGDAIDLPLLVPSITSKGFSFFKDRDSRKKHSETTRALELASPVLTNSLLISAYDLHHGHLRQPEQFFTIPQVLFIDSGGYELASDYDSTEPMQGPNTPKKFSTDNYNSVIRTLKRDLPIVVTNPDWEAPGQSIEDQILTSQKFFNGAKNFTRNFLLKPTNTKKGELRKYLQVEDILPHIEKLRAFDIIGVTEKELGKNMSDRLKNIAWLRAAMDRSKLDQPIHVWGGLDPVLTPLYFFAGAEIFDGVSWLSYAYHEGMAVYRDSFAILNGDGPISSSDHTRATVLFNNLSVLVRLTSSLRQFVDHGAKDFAMFEWHSKVFKQAYNVLCSAVPHIKGDA